VAGITIPLVLSQNNPYIESIETIFNVDEKPANMDNYTASDRVAT
jgi:hypothetical protein